MSGKTITERWEQIGILEGVPEERKEKVANAFEFILQTLLKQEEVGESVTVFSFPIIQRIMSVIDLTEDEILWIMTDCVQEYDRFDKNQFMGVLYTLDIEAEFTAVYVDKYLINHGHEPYKYN